MVWLHVVITVLVVGLLPAGLMLVLRVNAWRSARRRATSELQRVRALPTTIVTGLRGREDPPRRAGTGVARGDGIPGRRTRPPFVPRRHDDSSLAGYALFLAGCEPSEALELQRAAKPPAADAGAPAPSAPAPYRLCTKPLSQRKR
jgi:hypothetical protein